MSSPGRVPHLACERLLTAFHGLGVVSLPKISTRKKPTKRGNSTAGECYGAESGICRTNVPAKPKAEFDAEISTAWMAHEELMTLLHSFAHVGCDGYCNNHPENPGEHGGVIYTAFLYKIINISLRQLPCREKYSFLLLFD